MINPDYLYHCSHHKITSISSGRFGTFLFFSPSPSHYGNVVYKLDASKLDFVEANHLKYETWSKVKPFVKKVENLTGADEDTALDYLCQRDDPGDAEQSWDIQLLAAQAAIALGYDGIEVPDEHGTSYMVDMKKRFKDLTLCEANMSRAEDILKHHHKHHNNSGFGMGKGFLMSDHDSMPDGDSDEDDEEEGGSDSDAGSSGGDAGGGVSESVIVKDPYELGRIRFHYYSLKARADKILDSLIL